MRSMGEGNLLFCFYRTLGVRFVEYSSPMRLRVMWNVLKGNACPHPRTPLAWSACSAERGVCISAEQGAPLRTARGPLLKKSNELSMLGAG